MKLLNLIYSIGLAFVPLLAASPATGAQEAQQRAEATVANQGTELARLRADAKELMATYCFDCHDEGGEGGLDLVGLLKKDGFDGTHMFENLITARMPPKGEDQPTAAEKRLMLNWLAKHQFKMYSNVIETTHVVSGRESTQ